MGDEHRKQRKVLNPVFSVSNLKAMTPSIYEVGNRLRDTLAFKLTDGPRELDMLHWMSRTSLELIGQTGLGHSFDTLANDDMSAYLKTMKKLTQSFTRLSFIGYYILPWAVKIRSPRFWKFVVDIIPGWTDLHVVRDASDAIYEESCRIYNSKKLAMEIGDDASTLPEVGRGKDIIGVLMKANSHASEDERFSDLEIIGQMSCVLTFIFAAMDTTSVALSRIISQLAENSDAQDKLRDEFRAAREVAEGDVPYSQLITLPYLDAVYKETLRLYPPASLFTRRTNKDTVLPLAKPIVGVDGTEINEIPIRKNSGLIVSILNVNRNAEIWGPDAAEWKPERWLAPLPATDAHMPGVYSHIMTFSGGQRSCIGFKLAEVEIKVIVALLIESFILAPSEKEVVWRMSIIHTPVLKGSTDEQPMLPLTLSLVKP